MDLPGLAPSSSWPLIGLALVAGGSLAAFVLVMRPKLIEDKHVGRAIGEGAACAGLLAALVAVAAILPTSADPPPPNSDFSSQVDPGAMFYCTDAQSFCTTPLTSVEKTTQAKVVCHHEENRQESKLRGNWLYAFLPNGQEGLVSSAQARNVPKALPRCESINWINVAGWGIKHLGFLKSQSSDSEPESARPGGQGDQSHSQLTPGHPGAGLVVFTPPRTPIPRQSGTGMELTTQGRGTLAKDHPLALSYFGRAIAGMPQFPSGTIEQSARL